MLFKFRISQFYSYNVQGCDAAELGTWRLMANPVGAWVDQEIQEDPTFKRILSPFI